MPLIENVSDTARWVAMMRANESKRRDAHFNDPWAERLAGERGRAILAGMPEGARWTWPMVVRTVVMDRIITREVAAGCDVVVNLAAGLDMRPYRLDLPAALHWVEVDLAPILTEKEAQLANETPRCRVTRIKADLADAAQRRAALDQALAGATRALVVTEGLLIYLGADDVAALAADLAAQPVVKLWLSDLASPKLLEWMAPRWGKVVAEGGAPFRFGPPEGTGFFTRYGWREREFIGSMEAAVELKRTPPNMWIWRFFGLFSSPAQREQWRRFSGFMLLERAA